MMNSLDVKCDAVRLSQASLQINSWPKKNARGRVRHKTTLLSVGQLEEVAKRLPAAKDKKPEDFINRE